MDNRSKPLPADRLLIELSSADVHAVNQLARYGYGETPAAVVEYALRRFIDDMRRSGIVTALPVPDDDIPY